MKIVFLSNYFNHHQKQICEELYQIVGKDFVFVSTSVMREERKNLGYIQNDHPSYVCLAYKGKEQYKKAISLINKADVVIAGSAPEKMLKQRIFQGKLLFRYSERPFKKKISFLKKFYYSISFRCRDLMSKNIYVLCASAYAASDYAMVGIYKKRTFKWGYFPEFKKYEIEALLMRKKRNAILWCGRFIDWKHPDDAIRLAQKLKATGVDFQLKFIGTGIMEEELHSLVEKFGLTDCVEFLGSMSPQQVRIHMEETGVFLFTSDSQEGWGAVLNESMNSGCAVVASQDIGSVPFLIKDGINGSIYQSGNVEELFTKVTYLLENPDEQLKFGLNAYDTIASQWNANIAANRFLQLTKEIITGETYPSLFEEGICSRT